MKRAFAVLGLLALLSCKDKTSTTPADGGAASGKRIKIAVIPKGTQHEFWATLPGNPAASAAALLKVVDAEQPPLRVFFGASPLETAKADYESRIRNWEQWQPVAELAQG